MMVGDKVQFVNSGYPDFFGVKGYVEKFVNSGPDQIACLDNGRIFMTKNLEVVEQEPTNDFQRAWESVWDTICNHAPKDLFNQITQDGSGIENAVDLIKVLSKHYEESNDTASENHFKVGDRVKVVVSEGELIDSGCDESVQSGGVYTVQEVEEESLRLGPEDTCSWVAWTDVDMEPVKQASTLDSIQTFNVGDVISFTLNHKDIEISFEDGKIAAKDWRGSGEPVEYSFDMIEQFEEFMNAWEVMGKYHHEQE